MNAKSFNLSAQGASHIKKNKECQDASSSYYDDNMAIAIVCDGHGGDDYMRSAVGSLFGCEVAKKNIITFLSTITKDTFFQDPEEHLKRLEASIISGWNGSIERHFSANPFKETELIGISERAKKKYVEEGRIESAYGTTMIAVAMTREFWFGIHIGDGKCVAINSESKFVQPIPWDPKCFLNATTSICDSDALERFRHFYSEKLPAAVFVGSDGIDDCFSNDEQLNNLYKTILYSFGTSKFDDALNDLKDYLPRLSAKGSGDDVSIAAMFDFDLVPELEVVKEFDREKEKARVEENARKEAEKNEAERQRVEMEYAKFQRENNSKARLEKKYRICTKCGAKLADNMKFCGECGNPVITATEIIGQAKPQTPLFPESKQSEEPRIESVQEQLDEHPQSLTELDEHAESMEEKSSPKEAQAEESEKKEQVEESAEESIEENKPAEVEKTDI